MNPIKRFKTKPAFALACLATTLHPLNSAHAAKADVYGYVENATYVRDGVGLSKFRNTGQVEFDKPLDSSGKWSDMSINGTLRATYDGVYDLNDDEFGESSPNEAFHGQAWHGPAPGNDLFFRSVKFPCENGDAQLCRNLKDYADHSENDLKFPEFNDELDFVRELYWSGTYRFDNQDKLALRVGKQQVVWGKTDLFRVLDMINPVDYSRHNIYDELEDIRIPQWIVQAEWQMGKTGPLDESNLSVVWNFDKFRPNHHGTCGGAYQLIDLGCFYNTRVYGFDTFDPDGAGPAPAGALVGLNGLPTFSHVDIPESKMQGGVKWEGVYGDVTFSLNAYSYIQQNPALTANADPSNGFYNISFPRVNMVGGSLDYYAPSIDTVIRLEATHSTGEKVASWDKGHVETDVARYVIGLDKSVYLPSLSQSAFTVSGQVFGEHILDHDYSVPNKQDNFIATLLVKGFWMNNRLSPQFVIAHDFGGDATVFNPSIEYSPDDNWKFKFALNIKSGGDETFDTNALYEQYPGAALPFGNQEPLARFTNGPIGVAHREDEAQLSVRYSF